MVVACMAAGRMVSCTKTQKVQLFSHLTHEHTYLNSLACPFHHSLLQPPPSPSALLFSIIVRDGFIPVNARTSSGSQLGNAAKERALQVISTFSFCVGVEIKISCSLKITAGLTLFRCSSAVRAKSPCL